MCRTAATTSACCEEVAQRLLAVPGASLELKDREVSIRYGSPKASTSSLRASWAPLPANNIARRPLRSSDLRDVPALPGTSRANVRRGLCRKEDQVSRSGAEHVKSRSTQSSPSRLHLTFGTWSSVDIAVRLTARFRKPKPRYKLSWPQKRHSDSWLIASLCLSPEVRLLAVASGSVANQTKGAEAGGKGLVSTGAHKSGCSDAASLAIVLLQQRVVSKRTGTRHRSHPPLQGLGGLGCAGPTHNKVCGRGHPLRPGPASHRPVYAPSSDASASLSREWEAERQTASKP